MRWLTADEAVVEGELFGAPCWALQPRHNSSDAMANRLKNKVKNRLSGGKVNR